MSCVGLDGECGLNISRCSKTLRTALVENYSHVPQLSCGGRYDLDQPVPCMYSTFAVMVEMMN